MQFIDEYLVKLISTNDSELVFHVFGVIAHFERRLIAERTRDGLQAAAAKGRDGQGDLNSKKRRLARLWP